MAITSGDVCLKTFSGVNDLKGFAPKEAEL